MKQNSKSKIKLACEQLENAFTSFEQANLQGFDRDKDTQKKVAEFRKYFQKIGKQLKDFN